jgi:hypothetical protein
MVGLWLKRHLAVSEKQEYTSLVGGFNPSEKY